MKKTYNAFSGKIKHAIIAILLVMGAAQTAYACHGVGVIAPNFVVTPTAIIITGNSDPATCGCGPYYMQAEVAFTSACFTGVSPACGSASWNTYPWYFSLLDIPGYSAPAWTDNCVLEPYDTITIPYAQLCPGTSYVVRVREYVCGSLSAGGWSTTFTFTTPGVPIPIVVTTISDRYTACPGDTVNLSANATGGCPGSVFSYSWSPTAGLSNPNIANPSLVVPTANTVYTVTVTGQCGNPFTVADDTVGITVGPPPIPGAASAAPTSVCSGGSSVITLTGQDPASAIQWQVSPNGITWFNLPGATSATYNTGPLTSTLYYQAIIYGSGWWPGSGCGSVTSTPIMVTVNPSPVANAGANTTICNGSCANLTGTGGVTYDWQPGSLSGSNVTVCPTSNTTYTLTVTDGNGCTGTDNVLVTISNASVTASPDVSICNSGSTILFASGPAGNTYNWTPSGSLTGANTANPSATPTSTTNYTVTATNSFGCTAVDSVLVTVTPAPPITVSNDTTLCAGGNVTLTASGATSYNWQPGNLSGSSVTVNPNSTQTYTVTGTTSSCVSVDSVTVNITPPPFVFAGPDFDVCRGSQATMSVATTGTSYLWTPTTGIVGSNTTQSVIAAPLTTTSYTVTVVGPGGCISTDTINVTVNPIPTVTASSPDNTICVGSSTSVSAAGATTYSWLPAVGLTSPTSATSTANPSSTTTYQVVGTDANGCMDTASITIIVNPLPAVYITSTPSECGDTTGTMINSGVVTGTAPFTYTIASTTYPNLPINNLQSGAYTVITTDANGCTSTQVVTVGFQNTSFVTATANTYYGVYPLPVSFTGSGSSGLNNWAWNFGDGVGTSNIQNPSYVYASPGTYTVTLAAWNDNYGCAVFTTIVITVVDEAVVLLPNVFTPNGDGTNDGFSADISGVSDLDVTIYSRWGNVIYKGSQNGLASSPQTLQIWDGRGGNGNTCDDGVYYYVITVLGFDTKNYEFTGFVHLMKTNP